MICLHAFRMPAREDEEAFFSDPRNQRICYTAKEPFHVFRCCHLPRTHLPIPQEGRIITSDDVFGHLPDIRCINGGIDARPGPASGRRWTMCGSAGRSFGSGRQTSAPPENAPQPGRKIFWTAGQRNFFWRRCHAVAAIYNKGSKIREEAHPVAKHLDKFTQPFRDSPIPFALAEILTNGSGEMVDLVCRFLNPAAAALLGLSRRMCRAAACPSSGQSGRWSSWRPCRP